MDGAGMDGADEDGAGKEGAGKDGVGKDGVGKDGAGKVRRRMREQGAEKDGVGKDGADEDGAGMDDVGNGGAGKDGEKTSLPRGPWPNDPSKYATAHEANVSTKLEPPDSYRTLGICRVFGPDTIPTILFQQYC